MSFQRIFQAKPEPAKPLQTKSLFAPRPAPFQESAQEEAVFPPVHLGRDFSTIPFKAVHPAPALGPSSISCPFTPQMQAKPEPAKPLQTKSLFAPRSALFQESAQEEAVFPPVHLGRDFSAIPFKAVHPAPALGPSSISCPFTPQMQAKLKIGQPGDRYEQEADRVAEQVMRMPEPQVQRKAACASCADKDEEDKLMQTKPLAEQITPLAQRKPGPEAEKKDEDDDELLQAKSASCIGYAQEVHHPLIQSVLASSGQPLDAGMRSFMEPRFGQDFSGVRVHVGGQAAESARAVNARAYTVGRDVVFGEGQYAPGSDEGRRLMAHELAHVGQQRLTATIKEHYIKVNERNACGILRVATDPVVPIHPNVKLASGVGHARPNRVADVRTVQDRLLQLRYLSFADHAREVPAPKATGNVPTSQLTATIAAIRALQSDVLSMVRPNGNIDPSGRTLDALNRAIPRPTTAEVTTVGTAVQGITETVTRGVAITGSVGNVPVASVTVGTANRPNDIRTVQTRLMQLDHLAAGHGEQPAAGTTSSLPSTSLPLTRAAIIRFQNREVKFWFSKKRVTGSVTPGVVTPNDATHHLLDQIANYREQFATGEDITFRDFPRSGYAVHPQGASVTGTAAPSALPRADFTALGLTSDQAAALQYVSSHEGNFDALNTYDQARVSFGFIQFAGGRGLPPFMALLKSRNPAAFQRMFQHYGIDVEFNVVRGQITNAAVVVVDPASGRVLRDTAAEAAIRDSQRLSAIFIRSGRDVDVQRGQIEAATRDYVLPPLAARASFEADIIEVLSAHGGTVTATHAGAAARSFRSTPAFRILQTADRIRARRSTTQAGLGTLLTSQRGMAVLMDRAIQEGAGSGGGGVVRLQGAIRWVADRHGFTDIVAAGGQEQAVLQQVVDDFTADINIAQGLDRAITAIDALRRAAQTLGATVGGVLGLSESDTARAEVDAVIAVVQNKSFVPSRTRLETGLPPQRANLNFAPPPANIPALIALLRQIGTRLSTEYSRRSLWGFHPNADNARGMRARVQDILSSQLTS